LFLDTPVVKKTWQNIHVPAAAGAGAGAAAGRAQAKHAVKIFYIIELLMVYRPSVKATEIFRQKLVLNMQRRCGPRFLRS
jgi:hypothetical protein